MKTAALFVLAAGCFGLTSCETEVVGPGADAEFRRSEISGDTPMQQLKVDEQDSRTYSEAELEKEGDTKNEATLERRRMEKPRAYRRLAD